MIEALMECDKDTPTTRATVNQLHVAQLDEMLDQLRARRLVRVQKLESLARAKADDVRLTTYITYEKLRDRVQKKIVDMMDEEKKLDEQLHKLRVLVFKMDIGDA